MQWKALFLGYACRILTSSSLKDLQEGSWSYGDIGPCREVGEDEAFNKNYIKAIDERQARNYIP